MKKYPSSSVVLSRYNAAESTNCPVTCLPQANISHLVSLLQSVFSSQYLQIHYAFCMWAGEGMFYTDEAISLEA